MERIENPDFKTISRGSESYGNLSDQSVWKAFKQGDESAYEFMYRKYFSDLINYGHQFTKNDQLLEDCVQDLFIDLKRNRKNLTSQNTSIKYYLLKSLKRRILEYRKKDERLTREQVDNHIDFEIVLPVESLIIEKQIKESKLKELEKAMESLTTRQREVLYYMFYVGLSYEEIKDIMGFEHVRSVRNVFYKAISGLKNSLKFFVLINIYC
ncbi:RNA polymerase sigma factor [Sunxiuqinia sp. A32]|uniref:RNA polymerase sigma factor n=1 Tax=Sunxiuqinia sp. A32 TaxID=3461496 RepID=UPI004046839C